MTARAISTLEDHPNADEIVGVLALMVQLSDAEISALAVAWRDTDVTADARAQALDADTPLVLEVLAAFDSLAYLYADDLDGEASYVTLPAPVTALALKAVRDAVAAAYARPSLGARQYDALIAPWRTVFPSGAAQAPDFGPQHHDVLSLLGVLSSMACRSHDVEAGRRWSSVLELGGRVDLERHGDAVDQAWDAALVTQRRRLWGLVSRSGQEAFYRRCAHCERSGHEADAAVLALCLGAVVGVMMGDVLDDDARALLVAPLEALAPYQAGRRTH
ncbi:MAG TPA: hypothetical protein VNA12_07105 [Mycobacteriales bacterium]|nr:hypothetical protein [Mycobacteriales bacterium]